jgi:hypothetical protein
MKRSFGNNIYSHTTSPCPTTDIVINIHGERLTEKSRYCPTKANVAQSHQLAIKKPRNPIPRSNRSTDVIKIPQNAAMFF